MCYAVNSGAAINSVKTRNQFLRFDIVRFALIIPTEFKIRSGTTNTYFINYLKNFSAFLEEAYYVLKYMKEFKMDFVSYTDDINSVVSRPKNHSEFHKVSSLLRGFSKINLTAGNDSKYPLRLER